MNHLKDHLGNVRSVITPYNDSLIVVQTNDYFPFGMSLSNAISHSDNPNKHKYNGKEEQEMSRQNLTRLDYGFRFYDSQIARFHAIDPLATKNHRQTPYAYAMNNPIRYIDWLGLDTVAAAALTQAAQNAVNWVTNTYGSTTSQCNRGVNHAFVELTGSTELEGKTANDIVDHLEGSSDFESINRDDVQAEANDGSIVIAGRKESSGSGHVALAVPGEEVRSSSWGGTAPVGMDTGRNKRWANKGMNFSWSSPEGVSFYKYSGSSNRTANNQTYSGGTLPEVTVTAVAVSKKRSKNLD